MHPQNTARLPLELVSKMWRPLNEQSQRAVLWHANHTTRSPPLMGSLSAPVPLLREVTGYFLINC